MALYRTINMAFWGDPKISEEFTPEDKYFFLYLMTNPHTNLLGCYELSIKSAADETGYNQETIRRLLSRFEKVHKVITYSKTTKEVLILNWYKYNWTSSDKCAKALCEGLNAVKDKKAKKYLTKLLSDRVSIPYTYPMDTSVSNIYIDNTNEVNINNNDSNNYIYIKTVIDYLNLKCNKYYTYNNKSNNKYIEARLKEGHTVEEMKRVIDIKAKQWLKNKDLNKYLRPETLFGNKFEGYLNEQGGDSGGHGYDAESYYGECLISDGSNDGNLFTD